MREGGQQTRKQERHRKILAKDVDDLAVNAVERVGIGCGFPSPNQGAAAAGHRKREDAQQPLAARNRGEDGASTMSARALWRWTSTHADLPLAIVLYIW
jgi:hypothetical protein